MRDSTDDSTLSIGEVAGLLGVRTSALRYYEDSGLLGPVPRSGGKRRYDSETVDRLRLIRFCQQIGFSLAEIRNLLSGPSGRSGKRLWRELVDGKLAEIDQVIQRAEAMKQILNESRACDCITPQSCALIADVVGPRPEIA